MIHLALLNPENVSEEEAKAYPVREAARAVVFDKDGKVALLHVSKESYYKLPGGGIDDGEDMMAALARECREEIGCDIEVIGELGTITEYRKFETLNQISHCFAAKIKGEKGSPEFTQTEIDDGFEILWLPYEQALETLRNSKAKNLEGREYIVPRDTIFIEATKAIQ